MRIIFEAIVKENGIGGWYIEIKDTISNRLEKCNDLEEFSNTIEKMGEEYGGRIDEVKWQVDSNVTTEHLSEVKMKMSNYYKEIFNNSSN